MNYTTLSTAADRLLTRSPERIWGLSSGSVYTALAARSANDRMAERLSPHVRAEMLRTNDDRGRNDVIKIHKWIIDELGLVKRGDPTLLGDCILTAREPRQLIRAIGVARLRAAETVLRSCSEVEGPLPRREFDSLLADKLHESVLGPILGSLGFVTIYPDSVELNSERIKTALEAQSEGFDDSALAQAYRWILPHLVDADAERCLDDVVERVTGDRPSSDRSVREVAGALADGPPISVNVDELADAINEQRKEYEKELAILRSLLAPTDEPDLTRVDTDESISATGVPKTNIDDEDQVLVDIVATVAAHPELSTLDVTFVTDRLSTTPYAIYQALSSIPGLDCEVRDGVIEFDSVPASVEANDLREEYMTHLVERCSTTQSWIDTLSDVSVSEHPEPGVEDQVIADDYESLDDGDVAPAYFVYTLVNPDALGDKKMNAYVGDSRGLGREHARLQRWHENRPSGLRSYTAMTDRLFSLGLERELDEKILRIMSPFNDDTFNAYVSQIRRLLEQGFELCLLTRHTKEPWEWRRLQRNLLSNIKEHRDQIAVRTYSRFKNQQRVSPEMDFQDLGEFGIHGKLQIIGDAKEGAALLGSANFMENSYSWNPECGLYTERTQFIEATINFFDIVWDISEADELAVERLQEIPERQLIPTYYS